MGYLWRVDKGLKEQVSSYSRHTDKWTQEGVNDRYIA